MIAAMTKTKNHKPTITARIAGGLGLTMLKTSLFSRRN